MPLSRVTKLSSFLAATAMEEVTEAVNNLSISGGGAAAGAGAGAEGHKKNRIQVSNTKKPLFFYVNLAKVRRGGIIPIFSFAVEDNRRVCGYLGLLVVRISICSRGLYKAK